MAKALSRSPHQLCLAILLALLAAACENPVTPPTPTPTPAAVRSQGPLAFVSTRDNAEAIYLANADGSAVTLLAFGNDPAWSPDGRRIAFQRDRGIYVINADGSGLRLVAQARAGSRVSSPDWSPDGNRLAFEDSGVSVVDVTGLNGRKIVSRGYGPFTPVWSADGSRIAFFTGEIGADISYSGTWIVNPDGSGATWLGELWDAWAPAWSPNGAEIGFITSRGIGIARADGFGGRIVVQGSMNHPFASVGWTADGRLLYSGTIPHRSRIFVNDGGVERQLVPNLTSPQVAEYQDYSPAWAR